MPSLRLEDASCAICMDTLFNLKNDLDEVMPIATPDCGHVFHEKCLLDWFKIQSDQYVAQALEQGMWSPIAGDAPAECPQCRTECFADEETGKPMLHRLFINFGSDDGGMLASSQHPPSSPAPGPSTQRWGRSSDAAAMGLARRARNLANEVDGFTAESDEANVRGTLRRAETLAADGQAMSSKAGQALKKYVGGLSVALNKFTDHLESHPLIPVLQARVALLEEANAGQTRELRNLEDVALPRAVKKAVQADRLKSEKHIKRANDERDLIQRELEKEQVARVTFKRAMKEREDELEKRISDAKRALDKELEERVALTATLTERTKMLKVYQVKADSRKELKAQIEALKAENEQLKASAIASPPPHPPHLSPEPARSARPSAGTARLLSFEGSDNDDGNESMDITELIASAQKRRRAAAAEESLYIEPPSFLFDSSFDDAGPSKPVGRSTTSRTFTFDVDKGRVSERKAEKRKDKERDKEWSRDKGKAKEKAQVNDTLRDTRSAREIGKSKYFLDDDTPDHAHDILVAPSSPVHDDVLVAQSSPVRLPRRSLPVSPMAFDNDESPPKRHRPNPFATSGPTVVARRPQSVAVGPSKPVPNVHEILDLTGSSPPASPLPVRKTFKQPLRPSGTGLNKNRTPTIGDYMSIAEGNGKPKKNLAIGAKVKRRA